MSELEKKVCANEMCDEHIVHPEHILRAKEGMPDEDAVYDLADFFKIFGDSTRLKILCALRAGELCVCDIAEVVGMTLSAVSHQLRVLRQAKLVKLRRSGKEVIYSLDDEHIVQILELGKVHMEE